LPVARAKCRASKSINSFAPTHIDPNDTKVISNNIKW
jgi:hypothetical protein